MGNRILSFFICLFCLISCNNNKDSSKDNKNNLGTVYFVNGEVRTFRAVNCDDFISTLQHWISYLEVNDLTFKNEIISNIDFTNKTETKDIIDVRYRIEFDTVVICVDNFGYYSLNNEYKGQFKGFELLLKHIDENKQASMRLESFPE